MKHLPVFKAVRYILIVVAVLMSSSVCRAEWKKIGDPQNPIKSIFTREFRRDHLVVDFIYNNQDSTFRMNIYPTADDLRAAQIRLSYPVQISYLDCAFRFSYPDNNKTKTFKYRINTPNKNNINEMVGKGYFEVIIDDKDRTLYNNLKESKNVELPYYNFKYNAVSYIQINTRDF